ncbi:Uncharacterized membrane protein [Carnobacterium iners]|uniref:Uncharacterized membrane protein n=1 Tax=Carnobacterium iners TaxID=1073423 RepID=A0A1X7MXQ2_9LACT|nr:DUF2254 domain-containing protein [Carnobacterium iners]SEL26465.1 Uncharacterized membrane protein [Carnobacterium iners]SMH28889.1 Uncharacterized membrane protein [Carnobacterium iners]
MKIKQGYETIKKSIWLYPVVYSVLALLLAAIVVLLDNGYLFDMRPYLPDLLLTSASLAKSVLGVVSSAFITITTFTFSTTMVVLSVYMSEFSPRVVENFLADERTMKSFGIFVSGFIYSITCMLFIREEYLTKPILAGTIGVIYIIFGLFNFILFINSVGKYIQASNLIDRLYVQAQEVISIYKNEMSQYEIVSKAGVESQGPGLPIRVQTNGYIQIVDYDRLFEVAKKYQVTVRFNRMTGQFVTNEVVIGELLLSSESTDTQRVAEEIREHYLIGMRRSEEQDFNFSIQKMVEVALRALSPGTNDPNTAVFCINSLGLLLGELCSLKEGYVVMEEEGSEGKIYRETYDLDRLLRDTFLQIIHYGQGDVYVMLAVFQAYRHMTNEAKFTNREVIQEQAHYLFDRLLKTVHDSLEKKLIIEAYEDILKSESKF